MRVGPTASFAVRAAAVQLLHMTCRVSAHRSSPTGRPVESPSAIIDDTSTRRPSRHAFDISV